MTDTTKVPSTLLERLKASHPTLELAETKAFGKLYVRRQTGEDQLKIHALQSEISAGTLATIPRSTFAAVIGAVMLLNEDGSPAFPDPKVGYELLKDCGAEDLEELYNALMKHHRGRPAVEDAEKKLPSDQNSEPGTN